MTEVFCTDMASPCPFIFAETQVSLNPATQLSALRRWTALSQFTATEASAAKAACLSPVVGRRSSRTIPSGEYFVGVWGARNASLFRSEHRAHMQIAVRKEAPDARLAFWGAEKESPRRPVRNEGQPELAEATAGKPGKDTLSVNTTYLPGFAGSSALELPDAACASRMAAAMTF